MADIFLSYNREDAPTARAFAEGFEREGLSVWWDATLRSGEAYDEVTEAALKTAKAVVVLWSRRSVVSRWVRSEATVADRGKTLVPVMIEPCERPIMFELTQSAELCHWQGDPTDPAWLALISDLRRLSNRAPVAPPGPSELVLPSEPNVAPAGKRGEPPSLAVLPFTNRSGIAEDDVFAEGMVEDVIAALSQGLNVTVLSSMATVGLRRSAMTDLAEVGRRLGVRYLLEGNVRRSGNQLRVTAQILEAATGAVLWSARFDRPLDELAALQEDLVTELAASLDVQVQSLELRRILRKPHDLTAWEAVVRSYAVYQKLDANSLRRALEEAHRAAIIAPDYAAAHAQIALASSVAYLLTSPDDPEEVARISALIDRALALEPDDTMVLVATGCALNYIGRPDDALLKLTRAICQASGHGMAHYHLGVTYCLLDRHAEAVAHLDRAIRLFAGSPLLYLTIAWRAGALIRARRWEEGEAAFDEALALSPGFVFGQAQKAVCLLRRGRKADALAIFRELRLSDDHRQEQCETMLRRIFGESAAAEEMLGGVRLLWTEAQLPA